MATGGKPTQQELTRGPGMMLGHLKHCLGHTTAGERQSPGDNFARGKRCRPWDSQALNAIRSKVTWGPISTRPPPPPPPQAVLEGGCDLIKKQTNANQR